MDKKNILVIMGGTSTEREISLKTGEEIFKNLDREKYNVSKLRLDKNEDIFQIKDMKNIDFVYIALHGSFGEDGSVQAILETMNIKYSGPNMLSSSICMDKNICKTLLKGEVDLIPGTTMRKDNLLSFKEAIKYGNKLVLKQVNGGSSLGLYIVDNEKDYNNAIKEILKLSDEIVLEKYIKGIEISVPIIDNVVYPTVQITPLKSDTFDYESKYSDGGAKEEVVEFPKEIQKYINELTKKIYLKTKCSGFARIDYIISEEHIYMLEVNTLPGMTKASILPKSLASVGYTYAKTLDLLIESSIKK